jgi:hypothetical protein
MAISATSALASGVYTPTTTTVARTSNPALAARAASLSSAAGIVATLGGSSGAQVYSPAGLLNTLAHAGTAAALPGNGDTGTGTGTGAGNNATDLANSGQWASILKANPSAAAFVIGASYTSGIIDTLA